ncbi:hypothetical protein DMH03_17785 [Amycolatopsis sp. WAC 01376]|uniref:hypothetical protein n=1 Tax=Amycolatopsis sp. WAC 01376 TaxID=2203195 RepID=UPI000F7B6633|nr:hypothetical protein [Amycolatopsis sp. WAC 01376]RSM60600.1 hypothetical protein DMH03_17785 [Amycolatopsis sp. WAC 01376]
MPDTAIHEILGKYRSIKFDGKAVTITIVTGSWVSRAELVHRFRLRKIQAIEVRRPSRLDPGGMLTFRLSGEPPDLPSIMPAMSSKAPTNAFWFSKENLPQIEALVEAIEDALDDLD